MNTPGKSLPPMETPINVYSILLDESLADVKHPRNHVSGISSGAQNQNHKPVLTQRNPRSALQPLTLRMSGGHIRYSFLMICWAMLIADHSD